ncbi:MAG: hypothetical protein Q8L48_22205 [Archangium sp.]|nr:hypothetical protein [Archangium sp.]
MKRWVTAAGLVALVATGATSCVAIYGAPCTSRQLDGSNDGCPGDCNTYLEDGGVPARDPSNSCYKADGGSP